jgi:streptomycin 6-kinase
VKAISGDFNSRNVLVRRHAQTCSFNTTISVFAMESSTSKDLGHRVGNRISAWRIVVERVEETKSSILAFGQRGNQQVVLKVIRNRGDEWRSAEILDAFQGNGFVRVYDYVEGAMLLERLTPGHSLAGMAVSGADDDATGVLAATINAMSPRPLRDAVPSVQDWGKGFERYVASGDTQIPKRLLSAAHQLYLELCASQTRVRLLHGDLHHGNVLLDAKRGWVAVDPKGVIGEIEYEVGAALRNPSERPDVFANPAVFRRRVERFTRELGLDAARAQSWAFAQAILAGIWEVEDGIRVQPDHGWLALANALLPVLPPHPHSL